MTWLKTIRKEAVDLFVDDRKLVIEACSGVLAAGLVQLWTRQHVLAGLVLVVSLVGALIGSVWRGARPKG